MSDRQQDTTLNRPEQESHSDGVRRVNNWPVYLIAGAALAFLLIMMLVAMGRAGDPDAGTTAAEENAGQSALLAQEIVGNRLDPLLPDGTIIAPEAVPVEAPVLAPPIDRLPVVRPEHLNLPPLPSGNPRDEAERERIRQVKLQQFQDAVKASTAVQSAAPRSAGSNTGQSGTTLSLTDIQARIAETQRQIAAQSSSDPAAAYNARLAQLKSLGELGEPEAGANTGSSLLALSSSKAGDSPQDSGVPSTSGDRWALDGKMQAPRSAYELRAGFVIPATLISGINSELPGQIIAQVAQDVYDTASGKHKLIPQGTRLLGAYTNDVIYGQSRLLIAWQRLIFPDGKALDIGSMPGADSAGYAGLHDQVNNHYLRLFTSAVLMSAVVAGVALSQDRSKGSTGEQNKTASDAMTEALGQQLGQVTAQLIGKNLNIAPTLEIRPGYRFNVMVSKDLTFSKPYQSFDY